MPHRYERTCDYCSHPYIGQGARFCPRSCRQSWRNTDANPAQSDAARAKISAARIGKPTTTGRAIPTSQREHIAAALRGRSLDAEHRAAIGRGVRAAGNIPPRNAHLVGAAHPNWSGGHSGIRTADFRTLAYRDFRAAVVARDDWTCRDCSRRGGKLHVHHIKSWGEHPALRYDVANGVTLCVPCHHSRHRGQRRPVTVGSRTLAERESGRAEA